MARPDRPGPGVKSQMNERVPVVVIGAGQAGLAVSHELTVRGHEHLVLERAARLAEPWRSDRWDSFTLLTPNWSLQLPGFAYDGDEPDGFLSRNDVVDYLERYAASFAAPVRFSTEVVGVTPGSGSRFVLATNRGEIHADHVIVATGTFQRPKRPPFAADIPSSVLQLHSGAYRHPDALPPGSVLVVGTAQSGCQIAEELYQSGRQVYLCVSSAGRLPRRYRDHDIFWWLNQIGFLSQPFDSAPAPKSRFVSNPHLSGKGGGHTLNLHQFARDGVVLLGRITGLDGRTIGLAPSLPEDLTKADVFERNVLQAIDAFIRKHGIQAAAPDAPPLLRDGFSTPLLSELDVRAAGITSVIWATGYRFDYSWVRFPVFDRDGFPAQQQGISAVPGLCFLGMHWLHTRKSGLLLGVGEDATHVAAAIASQSTNVARESRCHE